MAKDEARYLSREVADLVAVHIETVRRFARDHKFNTGKRFKTFWTRKQILQLAGKYGHWHKEMVEEKLGEQ